MQTINLFQPGTKDITVELPSTWNECTREELHIIAKSVMAPEGFNTKAFLLQQFLQHRSILQKIKLDDHILSAVAAEDVVINGYPAFDFVFNENTLTEQPYNRIKLPGFIPCTVYGPLSAFNNLTVGEYEAAFIAYNLFKEESTVDHLAQLMAILWRPKHQPYLWLHPKTNIYKYYDADKMQPRFAKLPAWQLYTVFMWFTGCINHLVKLFPKVFTKPSPSGGDGGGIDLMAFSKSIHAAAGPKNGTRDVIRCTMVKEFLFECQEQIIHTEKQLEEMNNARKHNR